MAPVPSCDWGILSHTKVTPQSTHPTEPPHTECSVLPSPTADLNRTKGQVVGRHYSGKRQPQTTSPKIYLQLSQKGHSRSIARTPPEANGGPGRLMSSRFGCRSAFLVGNCANVGFFFFFLKNAQASVSAQNSLASASNLTSTPPREPLR